MSIPERLKQLRKKFNYTQEEMGAVCGIKKSAYSMIETGKTRLTDRNKEQLVRELSVNPEWLENGEGEMFRKKIKQKNVPKNPKKEFRLVPVYVMDAIGADEGEHPYILRYFPFINARNGDVAMFVRGNSMSPYCPGGATVLLRPVESWREYIEFWQIYLIVLNDGRRLLKELHRPQSAEKRDSHVLCVSKNQDYDVSELPLSMIKKMFVVHAIYYEMAM